MLCTLLDKTKGTTPVSALWDLFFEAYCFAKWCRQAEEDILA